MKKTFLIPLVLLLAIGSLCAQSDEDLFGSDDDLFGDDDFLIEEVEDVSAKTDLSKGILFDNGSVKIGGSLSASASLSTTLYQKDTKFADNLKNSTLSPSLASSITLDARPKQDLRLFSRFNLSYPFTGNVLNVKEMFTDFNAGDYVSFRFGLHTVTWGTGLFYSPVSDMINTSSIDPEHRDEQVDGSLNLRTLINIPGTMNNLWIYVIPDKGTLTDLPKVRDTALAVKGEFVAGGWELGAGAFYKYNTAPRAMLTASGSIKKWALFGEAVYQYGSDREWLENAGFSDKKSVIKATAGFMRSWEDPNISLLAQYYYDGNDFDASDYDPDVKFYKDHMDFLSEYGTKGHNIAVSLGFSKLFGCKDLSLSLLGLANLTKPKLIDDNTLLVSVMNDPELDTSEKKMELMYKVQMLKQISRGVFSATLNYAFNENTSIGFGPYITVADWKKAPVVALKLNFTLGGGKF